MPDNAEIMKKTLIYGFGLIVLLSGFGGLASGGLGLLGGPIIILTALLIMPITRKYVDGAIDSSGGPDLSTLGTGAFTLLIIAGLVVGAGLIPAADSPSTEGVDSPTSPSNSTDSPNSTPDSSPDDSDSTSDSSTDDTTDSPDSPPDDSSGDSSDSTSDSPDDTTSDSSDDSSSDSPDDSSDSGPETSWTVTVVSVTDGDTMDVRMPDGSTDTIRLLGVDTPETSAGSTDPSEWQDIPDTTDGREWLEQWGGQASGYAEDRLAGQEIYIEVDEESDRRGTYDRLLVYASQSESSSKSFNLRLIENGYARMYDSQFTQRFEYQSAENTARSNDVGVWDYTEPTSSPPSSGDDQDGDLVVSTIQAEAPGNDHEYTNSEYMEFTNEAGASIDMTGWTLADEADHTYYFPTGFTLGAGESVTVYSGDGSNTDSELYWGSGTAIWNNGGDTIIVTNDSGETVISREY